MKKILAFLLASAALLGALSGCGNSKGEGNTMGTIENMAEEDLPYGSTMKELKDSKLPVCFDKRYISDDVMIKVADYFYAVQTNDEKLFRSASNVDYLEYVEKNTGQSVTDYLKDIKANEETAIGSSFSYKYLEVTDCKKKGEDTQIDEIVKLMDQICKDGGKADTFDSTIKEAYALTVDITSDANGSNYNNEVNVYVFDCSDGIYVFN